MLGILTVLAFVLGLLVLWPRAIVEPEGPIEATAANPISFRITNNGFLPLWNIHVLLGICELNAGDQPMATDRCNGPLGARISPQSWRIGSLTMDERFTIRLDDWLHILPPAKFGSANISIVVEYQLWFVPGRHEKEFRFVTRKEQDGSLTWVQRPIWK